MDIKARARKLVKFFKTRDPFEMVQGMNVIVVHYPLQGVRGFYQYFKRNNIIYIDETLSERDAKFVCAHELGHMLLHKTSNAIFMDTRTHFNTGKYETEADTFAIELFIDDKDMEDYTSSGYTIEQIATLTGYQPELIEMKLQNLKN